MFKKLNGDDGRRLLIPSNNCVFTYLYCVIYNVLDSASFT